MSSGFTRVEEVEDHDHAKRPAVLGDDGFGDDRWGAGVAR